VSAVDDAQDRWAIKYLPYDASGRLLRNGNILLADNWMLESGFLGLLGC
jgi:hypothetical protein